MDNPVCNSLIIKKIHLSVVLGMLTCGLGVSGCSNTSEVVRPAENTVKRKVTHIMVAKPPQTKVDVRKKVQTYAKANLVAKSSQKYQQVRQSSLRKQSGSSRKSAQVVRNRSIRSPRATLAQARASHAAKQLAAEKNRYHQEFEAKRRWYQENWEREQRLTQQQQEQQRRLQLAEAQQRRRQQVQAQNQQRQQWQQQKQRQQRQLAANRVRRLNPNYSVQLASYLSNAALERTRHRVRYDGRYIPIAYPNGDVPASIGVCTDTVIRSYRRLGVDLQRLVHEDMSMAFYAYPNLPKWGLQGPDPNIDHRRVHNLKVFFTRNGQRLPVSRHAAAYQPGDMVTWSLGGDQEHIGIVVNQRSPADPNRFMIVHNVGEGEKMEDVLFKWPITGHFRYYPFYQQPYTQLASARY